MELSCKWLIFVAKGRYIISSSDSFSFFPFLAQQLLEMFCVERFGQPIGVKDQRAKKLFVLCTGGKAGPVLEERSKGIRF